MSWENGRNIGVVSATSTETAKLAGFLGFEGNEKSNLAGVEVICGTWRNLDIVMVKTGVGKVHAAMGTQMLIDSFQPDVVINVGVAASLGENLSIGDVVVPTSVIQWDFNLSALYPHTDNQTEVTAPKTVESAGIIATGDTFVADERMKGRIRATTGAVALDMESAAVAEVCSRNKIPCLIIKGISDVASLGASDDLKKNLDMAMQGASLTLETVLLELSEGVGDKK